MSFGPFGEAFYESSEYRDEVSLARTRRLGAYYSADQPCERCSHPNWLHAPNCVATEACPCESFDESGAVKSRVAHGAN